MAVAAAIGTLIRAWLKSERGGMVLGFDQIWINELSRLDDQGLTRALTGLSDVSATHAVLDGKRLLLCAANNYLGMAQDPRVVRAGREALRQYGAGATGSRLTTGHRDVHAHLERAIADWKGTARALVFSSGYLANVGAITSVVGSEDAIFSDAFNHASIIDGCRLSRAQIHVYRHADMVHLQTLLKDSPPARRRLIVTDGVFSMDGDIAPLPEIVELARRHDAMVMVDDAHATGVLGQHGAGTAAHFGLAPDTVTLQIGTLSKALGVEGAFVAGSESLISYLINRARPFIFNTSIAPATAAAALESVRIVREEQQTRESLAQSSQKLRADLRAIGCAVPDGVTPIIPVIIGDAKMALVFAEKLMERGVYAPAIRPPTVPHNTARIRIALSALHSEDDLLRICTAFRYAQRAIDEPANLVCTSKDAVYSQGSGDPDEN